jgi:hypothetical protein
MCKIKEDERKEKSSFIGIKETKDEKSLTIYRYYYTKSALKVKNADKRKRLH